MKIKEMIDILNAKVLTSNCDENKEYDHAFASDLMSDVLAYADSDTVLVTGLNNPQVIRTAEMMDISLIILVRGKQPSNETIELAEENMMTVLATDCIMFKACGMLYYNGLKGLE